MVVLEPFTEADFDRLIGWIPSSDFLLQWAGPDFEYPLTRERLSEHLTGAQGDLPSKLIYKVVDSEDGTVIGHIELAAMIVATEVLACVGYSLATLLTEEEASERL